jgi:hypothetical protein
MNLLNSATALTAEVEAEINDAFEYHTWDETKVRNGARVREGLKHAIREIILNVPPSADRSAAIRKIREARMDCNSAITHNGRY